MLGKETEREDNKSCVNRYIIPKEKAPINYWMGAVESSYSEPAKDWMPDSKRD